MEGDYQICFDNSFSRFSEKMVFFEIIVEGQAGDTAGEEEWAGLGEADGNLLEYKLDDIRVRRTSASWEEGRRGLVSPEWEVMRC